MVMAITSERRKYGSLGLERSKKAQAVKCELGLKVERRESSIRASKQWRVCPGGMGTTEEGANLKTGRKCLEGNAGHTYIFCAIQASHKRPGRLVEETFLQRSL